ncbi:MAG: hypothetical protein GY701_34465, partial [Sulfitobacter sp.]|nr:hypothetical protein [Sulfitobacter sp.]
LLRRLTAGKVPSLLDLERRFEPRNEETRPDRLLSSGGFQHPLALYDALLSPSATEVH